MFHEYRRPTWVDKKQRLNYSMRVGDRVRIINGNLYGVVVNRVRLSDLLSSQSEAGAREILDRLKSEHEDVSKYCIYQVSIKDLILELEPSDIEPDNSYKEGEADEPKEVEKVSPGAEDSATS